MKILPFVQPSGNGYDLPKGCIVQMDDKLLSINWGTERVKVDPNCDDMKCHQNDCTCLRPGSIPRFVYWNPNGVAISNDKFIRTICYNPHKAIDGTDMFFEYQKYQKAEIIKSSRCNLIMVILIYLKKDWVALIRIRMDLLLESVDPMRVR